MNFKALALTALALAATAGSASAGIRDQYNNPTTQAGPCDTFRNSATWVEDGYIPTSTMNVLKGGTMYYTKAQYGDCEIIRRGSLGQTIGHTNGYGDMSFEYHIEGGQMVQYQSRNKFGNIKNSRRVLEGRFN